jgi:hypothetical protein
MTLFLILAGLALAGIAAARLFARAVEAEHLVVLRPHGREPWLFERDGDGLYHRLPLAKVPAALRRFACGVPVAARVRVDA